MIDECFPPPNPIVNRRKTMCESTTQNPKLVSQKVVRAGTETASINVESRRCTLRRGNFPGEVARGLGTMMLVSLPPMKLHRRLMGRQSPERGTHQMQIRYIPPRTYRYPCNMTGGPDGFGISRALRTRPVGVHPGLESRDDFLADAYNTVLKVA